MTSYPDTLIFLSPTSLREYLDQSLSEYSIYNIPQKDKDTYYILIYDQIYLVRNVKSYEEIIKDQPDYSYYIFNSPSDITVEGESSNVVGLVWNENDILYYSKLIEIK
jgi:hypothetical protein